MWFDVMSCHLMWCDFLCCVKSGDATRCHVMSSHVMSCHLLWSDAMQWDGILWACDAMWLVAMSRCVVRGGCVMWWIGRCSGDPYYKVLLRTARYYKILIRTAQYYQVLLRTTRNYKELLRTTKCYSILHSNYNKALQNTTKYYLLRTTKYYKMRHHLQCADETSFTMRGATGVTSVNLALARKMAPMIDPRHTWNVIYLTRSNRRHPPTSPNTAPATKNDSHHWSSGIYETSFTMRRTTSINLQPHQILRLPGKIALQNLREICQNLQWRTIPAWSDHDPNMIRTRTRHLPKFHQTLPLPRKLTRQHHQNENNTPTSVKPHQMLRLPRKVILRHHQMLRLLGTLWTSAWLR